MNEKMKLLKEKFDNLPNLYDDFAEVMLRDFADEENGVEKILAELERRPDMTTSDIIEFYSDMIGIPKFDVSKIPPLDMN